jgi:hypothetical protein
VPALTTVQVTVTNGPGNALDWISLHAVGANDLDKLDWKYLNGTRTAPTVGLTEATVTFQMPQMPGRYEFRFFRDGSYARLATSSVVTVAPPTLTVSASVVRRAGRVTVTLTQGPGFVLDLISLHEVGASDADMIRWKYLSGTKTPPATGLTEATLQFRLPPRRGQYEFRFFVNGSIVRLATSPPVTVR